MSEEIVEMGGGFMNELRLNLLSPDANMDRNMNQMRMFVGWTNTICEKEWGRGSSAADVKVERNVLRPSSLCCWSTRESLSCAASWIGHEINHDGKDPRVVFSTCPNTCHCHVCSCCYACFPRHVSSHSDFIVQVCANVFWHATPWGCDHWSYLTEHHAISETAREDAKQRSDRTPLKWHVIVASFLKLIISF